MAILQCFIGALRNRRVPRDLPLDGMGRESEGLGWAYSTRCLAGCFRRRADGNRRWTTTAKEYYDRERQPGRYDDQFEFMKHIARAIAAQKTRTRAINRFINLILRGQPENI